MLTPQEKSVIQNQYSGTISYYTSPLTQINGRGWSNISLPRGASTVRKFVADETRNYDIITTRFGGTGIDNDTRIDIYADDYLQNWYASSQNASGFSNTRVWLIKNQTYYIKVSSLSNGTLHTDLRIGSVVPNLTLNSITNVILGNPVTITGSSTLPEGGAPYNMAAKITGPGLSANGVWLTNSNGTYKANFINSSYIPPSIGTYKVTLTSRSFPLSDIRSEIKRDEKTFSVNPVPAPAVPSPSATATFTSVTVSWPDVPYAKEYRVHLYSSEYEYDEWFDISGTSRTFTGLRHSTQYHYKVRASNGSGLVSDWSETKEIRTPTPIYTVSFDANGGSVSPTFLEVSAGSSVKLPTPIRSNYTFDGWYTDQTGGTRVGGAGASYTVNSIHTLYARWSAILVTGVWLSWSSTSLTVGDTLQLNAYVTPSDATEKSVTWSSNSPSIATVDSSGKVTAIKVGTATIRATAQDGTGIYGSCEVTVTPLLLYQTRNTEVKWFQNSTSVTTESIRPDLYYGGYNGLTEEEIRSKIPIIPITWDGGWTDDFGSFIIIPPAQSLYLPVSERKQKFLDMVNQRFTNDTFKPILADMINHFMGEKINNFTGTIDGYSIYKNPSLTNQVYSHSESIRYVNSVKTALNNCLGKSTISGNLAPLEYDSSKRFNYTTRKEQIFVAQLDSMGDSGLEPVFDSDLDEKSGFKIAIHGLHGNKIEIISYTLNGKNYSGTMKVTYYDHFGLNEADMTGGYPNSFEPGPEHAIGFRQWFILQHWKDLGASVQPKPFITTIEFTVPFSGVIN